MVFKTLFVMCILFVGACDSPAATSREDEQKYLRVTITKVGKMPPDCGVFANYLEIESHKRKFAAFCPEMALLKPINVGDICDIRIGPPDHAFERSIELSHLEIRDAYCNGEHVYDGQRVYGEN